MDLNKDIGESLKHLGRDNFRKVNRPKSSDNPNGYILLFPIRIFNILHDIYLYTQGWNEITSIEINGRTQTNKDLLRAIRSGSITFRIRNLKFDNLVNAWNNSKSINEFFNNNVGTPYQIQKANNSDASWVGNWWIRAYENGTYYQNSDTWNMHASNANIPMKYQFVVKGKSMGYDVIYTEKSSWSFMNEIPEQYNNAENKLCEMYIMHPELYWELQKTIEIWQEKGWLSYNNTQLTIEQWLELSIPLMHYYHSEKWMNRLDGVAISF